MSLETKISALAQYIAADLKGIANKQGDLTSLTTAQKSNLVEALNEIHALASVEGLTINDLAGAGVTDVAWSAGKIYSAIEEAKAAVTNSLVNGASAVLDTLSELSAALNNDPNFAATLATEIANRVRYDSAQTLDTAQKLQACQNIGIGNPEVDLVAIYTAAKV